MGFFQDLLRKRKEKEQKFKEWQENERIGDLVQERKKSHGERELEKIMEREKQKIIQETLQWEEKRRIAEEKFNARQMMKFNPEFFNDNSVLKQRSFLLGGFS